MYLLYTKLSGVCVFSIFWCSYSFFLSLLSIVIGSCYGLFCCAVLLYRYVRSSQSEAAACGGCVIKMVPMFVLLAVKTHSQPNGLLDCLIDWLPPAVPLTNVTRKTAERKFTLLANSSYIPPITPPMTAATWYKPHAVFSISGKLYLGGWGKTVWFLTTFLRVVRLFCATDAGAFSRTQQMCAGIAEQRGASTAVGKAHSSVFRWWRTHFSEIFL